VSGRDIGASVRQRLLNKSRTQGRPFQELLQYFAMERFLYRIAKSPYSDRFVLKVALLLTAWRAPQEDADYEGVRVQFHATLARARIPMQLDIGFGDVITPGPQSLSTQACWISLRLCSGPIPKRRSLPRSWKSLTGAVLASRKTVLIYVTAKSIKVRTPRGSHSLSWIDDVRRAKGGVPFRQDPYQTPGTIGTVKEDYSSTCTTLW
jgi:hypothetical protein